MNAKNARLTVYIPVYNGSKYVGMAIESILKQTYQDYKIIVCDNCSTDDTVSVVSNYISSGKVFLTTRVINIGMLGNFNSCLDDLDTEYYMILSHDDYLYDREALELGVAAADKNPEIPSVYCETLFVDSSGLPICRRKFGFSGLENSDCVAKTSIVAGRNCFGVPLIVRSSALLKKRYDGSFLWTGDFELAVSLGRNKNVYFIPKAMIAIRFHKSNWTAREYGELLSEFKKIAQKHNISMTNYDLFIMRINNMIVRIKKKLFFYYLDHLRK